jgi:hypothetical protein
MKKKKKVLMLQLPGFGSRVSNPKAFEPLLSFLPLISPTRNLIIHQNILLFFNRGIWQLKHLCNYKDKLDVPELLRTMVRP